MNRKLLTGALVAMVAFFLLAVTASASHAPTNLRIVRDAAKSVTIGWDAVPGVTGYGLFVDGTRVATAGPAATQARFGTPEQRQYVLGVSALKTGGAMSTITVAPRWVVVSVNVPEEPNPPPPAPTVSLTSQPSNPTTSTTATFAWSSTNATSFTCKLDALAAAACTSPVTYTVAVGTHTFVVTASGTGGTAQTSATWTVQDTPVPGNLTLTPVDGGTAYYAQFANPLSSSADFFPIGVWGSYDHTQANRDLDFAAGLNTYVWAADNSYVDDIRADGRFKVIQDSDNRANTGTETAGWLTQDELDMRCGPPGCDGYTQLENQIRSISCVTRCADGRFLYANYGKGVMFWETDAQAAQWINGTSSFGRYQDVVSNDIYWMTDPNERSTPGYGLPASYGKTVDRMRFLDGMDGQRKPIWNFVETGWPFTESASAGGRAILPAELRAAVWHSLIAGARGIIYFQHSFGGPHIGDHHTIRTNSEGTRAAVVAVDAQVKSLASVLNSPTVSSGVTTSGPVRAMVKWNGTNFYVFAGSTGAGGTGTVSIPCVGNATATVLGESGGTRTVTSGAFTDTFADKNAVHIYRVDGGSRCGL